MSQTILTPEILCRLQQLDESGAMYEIIDTMAILRGMMPFTTSI